MSEAGMRQNLVRWFPTLDIVSVETRAKDGVPDTSYGGRWEGQQLDGVIELKWDRRWPVKDDGIFQVPHYTQHQRVWHARRWRKGGNCFVLLQVAKDWLLFDGLTASQILGRVPKAELMEAALKHWVGSAQVREELPTCLNR